MLCEKRPTIYSGFHYVSFVCYVLHRFEKTKDSIDFNFYPNTLEGVIIIQKIIVGLNLQAVDQLQKNIRYMNDSVPVDEWSEFFILE